MINERAKFNRRDQATDESDEQYITSHYRLVETCEYGMLKEEMLRDRIVVAIRDLSLSEKLQMDSTLTLENEKKQVRQKEAVQEQRQEMHYGRTKTSIEEISRRQKPDSGKFNYKKGATQPKSNKWKRSCFRCGQQWHRPVEDCPARKATCFKCNRKGHFGNQCLSATASAQEIEVDSGEEDGVFLGAVGNSNKTSWITKIRLQGTEVVFKVDTGAEVTVISEEAYKNLRGTKLQTPSKTLYGPSHQKLEVVGVFEGTLTKDRNEHDERLRKVLERLQESGVTLNNDKCEFWKTELKFLGHMVSRDGVRADPDKTKAIVNMKATQSVTELRRFMGMINQLGKFSSKISRNITTFA